jgi:hypothetical protein
MMSWLQFFWRWGYEKGLRKDAIDKEQVGNDHAH